MSIFNKEKSDVKPEKQVPKGTQQIDLSTIKIEFTGTEMDQILKYLSSRPWAEVTNLMDMIRTKLAQTKIHEENV